MHRIFFFIVALFVHFSLFSTEMYTFQQLPAESGKEIEIRGFLYPNSEGKWILASEPNLRTCCVGNPDKAAQQIQIENLAITDSPSQAVLVRGVFLNEGKYYKMDKAEIIPHETEWLLYVATSIIIMILAVYIVAWVKRK